MKMCLKVTDGHKYVPDLIFNVFLHSAEKIPSVQSFVATSSLPNICAAVIAFGFIRISLRGTK